MYPIALVLFVGLAIAVERFMYVAKAKKENDEAFESILPHLKVRNLAKAIEVAKVKRCGISSVIGAGIARMSTKSHQQSRGKREDVEYAMEEGLMETIPKMQERLPYLSTLANIATLLGLLGTIIGLIAAFTAVADADPAEKAKLLSLSISVAMNTTAFGLMAAIPLLICHALLQTKTTKMIDAIEMAGVKFLNIIDSDEAIKAEQAAQQPEEIDSKLEVEFAS